MIYPIHEYIRRFAKGVPEGDVTKKFRAQPKVKPPRRKPSVQNESSRSDYMKVYMEEYRGEEGKDYQKMPDKIKELRKKQKKERKEKKGSIEDVRVYNKALSPARIGQIYIKDPNFIQTTKRIAQLSNVGIDVNYPTAMLNITSNDNNVLIIS